MVIPLRKVFSAGPNETGFCRLFLTGPHIIHKPASHVKGFWQAIYREFVTIQAARKKLRTTEFLFFAPHLSGIVKPVFYMFDSRAGRLYDGVFGVGKRP